MTSKFYESVIEEERKLCQFKESSLKKAAIEVSRAYSKRAINRDRTFVNYGKPANRCAYIYKYCDAHTHFVAKYFRNLSKKKQIENILCNNKEIKICCLGGGPGTDFVGVCKALAVLPFCHKAVAKAVVLDLCGGWKHSFNIIVSQLLEGKFPKIPQSFFDREKFCSKLINVNLLSVLTTEVTDAIQEADIVCMIKFASAVMASPDSMTAFKNISSLLKPKTVLLFIDNMDNVKTEQFGLLFEQAGFDILVGPLREVFVNRVLHKKETFGCEPLKATKLSIIGCIKRYQNVLLDNVNALANRPVRVYSLIDEFENGVQSTSTQSCNVCILSESQDVVLDDDDLKKDGIDEDCNPDKGNNVVKVVEQAVSTQDKFSQTYDKYLEPVSRNVEIANLIKAVTRLENALQRFLEMKSNF